MLVGVPQRARIAALGLSRIRVGKRQYQLQHVENLPPRRFAPDRRLPRRRGEGEKILDIAREEFAQRHRDQVGCGAVLQVETRRHAADIAPSVMLLRAARSVGESHGDLDRLSPEVLRDAIIARHIRRREAAFHADADGMDRPGPGLVIRKIGNNGVDQPLRQG